MILDKIKFKGILATLEGLPDVSESAICNIFVIPNPHSKLSIKTKIQLKNLSQFLSINSSFQRQRLSH